MKEQSSQGLKLCDTSIVFQNGDLHAKIIMRQAVFRNYDAISKSKLTFPMISNVDKNVFNLKSIKNR
jgi:hypothetical protein